MPTIAFLGAEVRPEFAQMDEDANAVTRIGVEQPLRLGAITALAALEVYEKLHALKNRLRKEFREPEIPLPDVALVVLAFLRRVEALPGEGWTLAQIAATFAEVVREIQERRLEHATER